MNTNQEYIHQIIQKNEDIQILLKKIKIHNIYTYEHSLRVAEYMLFLLSYFPEIKESKEIIVKCCLLHDIGKIEISNCILDKEGPLNNQEKKIIRKHPIIGLPYLSNYLIEIKNACLLHHEKLDGSGYPYGYTEEFIPSYIQLLSIIDIIDAVTGNRPYRKPCKSYNELKSILEEYTCFNKINIKYTKKILDLIKKGLFLSEIIEGG